jgi:hypothetical protein
LTQADKESVIEAIYLAKSVEAMELNLSSKVKDNRYNTLNLEVSFFILKIGPFFLLFI